MQSKDESVIELMCVVFQSKDESVIELMCVIFQSKDESVTELMCVVFQSKDESVIELMCVVFQLKDESVIELMCVVFQSKDAIQAYWAASGLKFSDFGTDERAANFVSWYYIFIISLMSPSKWSRGLERFTSVSSD